MASVLVIGDSCVDEYQYCRTSRLAPEMPVPVVEIIDTHSSDGMAANVSRNLTALGCDNALITNTNWQNIRKTRVVDGASNHMFVRLDRNQSVSGIDLRSIPQHLPVDAIIISDYDKGFLSEEAIEFLTRLHPLVVLDTKKTLGDWANDAAYIKINEHEFERSDSFMTTHLRNKIICTMGPRGCSFRGKRYPAEAVNVRDVSGAGDTFVAAFTYQLCTSHDVEQSIRFAVSCSTQIVQQRGMSIPDGFGRTRDSQ